MGVLGGVFRLKTISIPKPWTGKSRQERCPANGDAPSSHERLLHVFSAWAIPNSATQFCSTSKPTTGFHEYFKAPTPQRILHWLYLLPFQDAITTTTARTAKSTAGCFLGVFYSVVQFQPDFVLFTRRVLPTPPTHPPPTPNNDGDEHARFARRSPPPPLPPSHLKHAKRPLHILRLL